MSTRDPADAVEVLDLLLKFFGDGERWGGGRLSDRPGNRCLVGALEFVSSHHAIQSDPAERYLADEISSATACTDAGGDCARFRASLRALSGGRYRVSRLSFAGTVFLILTTVVGTSPSWGRSSSRRARRRRWMTRMPYRCHAGVSTSSWTNSLWRKATAAATEKCIMKTVRGRTVFAIHLIEFR